MKTTKFRLSIAAILYGLFAFAAFLVIQGETAAFDAAVYARIAAHITPFRTDVMRLAADFGDVAAVVAICAVLLILPFARAHFGVAVSINAAFTAGANEVIKGTIQRTRPEFLRLAEETSYSFPSGHAMNNAALYTMLAFLVFRCTWKTGYRIPALAAAFLFPFLIGLSRVYLGVHYASDVAAGWILGVAISLTADTLYSLFAQKKHPAVVSYDGFRNR